MSNKKSLFICMTPLQILIARSIIISKKILNYSFLVFYYNDNKKYKYYIDLLKKECSEVSTYKIDSRTKVERFFEIGKFKRFLKENGKFNFYNVYISSVDNVLIHTSLQKISFTNLYTYDDGLANLYSNSSYYLDKESNIQKIIKRFLGIRWSLSLIKNKSLKHYSIYKNKRNIIEKVAYIDLIPSSGFLKIQTKEKRVLKLYIGQPLHEIDSCFTKVFLKNALKRSGVEYYFPHPRENIQYEDFKYIESNLILEDFYTELSEKYNVQLYTFFSTAVLNIKMIDPKQNSFILYNDRLKIKFKNLYKVFDGEVKSFVDIGEIDE
ncbi:glycosyltransferase family 52 protein [Acinetobacter baumannii]|uniref:glycosyltransferase family 52 n=1 Tax=Acinetobacter baumannii TaxID=470 RepID=UPI00294009C7|nr:glycosyltransferase family 52 [Acinetobacter baumannii]MDV4245376.1 glycosyltransferase family 52 protein [Acinetobacter baumannii]